MCIATYTLTLTHPARVCEQFGRECEPYGCALIGIRVAPRKILGLHVEKWQFVFDRFSLSMHTDPVSGTSQTSAVYSSEETCT